MAKAKAKTAGDKGGKTVRVVTETVEEREEPGGELELDEELPGDDPDEDRDALAEIESLAGSGARYEVRRTAPAPFTGYVGTYSRDIFTPDLLQQEWGGGNFTLRVKNSKGEYVGSRQIVLAGEAHHKREPAAPIALAPQSSGMGGDAMAGILAAIQAGNKAAQDANAGQIGLLTNLVTSLINRPAPEAPKAPDPIAIIASLKEIIKPDRGDSAGESIKLFMQGLTMGKDLGGSGGSGEDSMLSVASKGFDTLKELAAVSATQQPARQARPVARRPGLPAAPAPGSVAAVESAAPVAPNNVEAPATPAKEMPVGVAQQITWIKQQTVTLSQLAHREKDPTLYAEVFLDNLPPFITREMIYEQMTKPDAVQRLAFLNPNVGRYAAWFEEFRKEVVELLENPDEDTPDELVDSAVVEDPEVGAIIDHDGETGGGG